MKHLFSTISLLFLFSYSYTSNAQYSGTISIESFPRNPQVGQYNYFGIRATVSFKYEKNVVVTGYIHAAEDEENNQDHPFTLTVFAGDLTAETSDDFYQTDPTGTASVTIASIVPYPHSWEFEAANPSNPYDSVGKRHNLGMINCLNQSTGNWVDRSANYIKNMYPQLSYDTLIIIATVGSDSATTDPFNFTPRNMSNTSQNYYSQLIYTIDNVEESSEIGLAIESIKNLESNIFAASISSEEKKALLSASSVARHSLFFWLEKVDSMEYYSSICYPKTFNNDREWTNLQNEINNQAISGPSYLDSELFISFYSGEFKKGWFRKLLNIVVGDVVGSLAGAVAGAFVLGEPGIIFGAVLGGMGGSLAAADGEGIIQL